MGRHITSTPPTSHLHLLLSVLLDLSLSLDAASVSIPSITRCWKWRNLISHMLFHRVFWGFFSCLCRCWTWLRCMGSQEQADEQLHEVQTKTDWLCCVCSGLHCVTLQSHYVSKLLKDNTFYIEHPLPFSVSVLLSSTAQQQQQKKCCFDDLASSRIGAHWGQQRVSIYIVFPTLYCLFGLNRQSAVLLPGRPLRVVYFCRRGRRKNRSAVKHF